MTTENLYYLAANNNLGEEPGFAGYCLPGAIDSCFEHTNVPLIVYQANYTGFAMGEIGQEGQGAKNFYQLLGQLAFNHKKPENFMDTPYYVSSLDELRTDLFELRGRMTIILDVNDGTHSVGLKPFGDNPDEWHVVGTDQIIAASSEGDPLDVQKMKQPAVISTKQVWDYLITHNSPNATRHYALIFPPEPS